ncbi:DUF1624 domain-containing protein [Sphingomonas ginkgonis]|uniref:DUF1624 domain-containing protein n=1 Tax=Sphingomonas ginkgonis TaxID=2315330 RepID=A0A3R9WQC9_9SPHN|nr:heparan-alpha-glucosaminide N-acetyltransferase domain-containing protein [Sphingomonas ginkgonis]RST31818.1 DUF1624 domain-containing protein [Sphingomonas ginkgonis]
MSTRAAAVDSAVDDPLVEPRSVGLTRAGVRRLDAIDLLRGLMIALMVLDHVRDFFGGPALHNPTDPATSWPLLFATRWVTHLCAPTFVLLAGTSIYLQSLHKEPGALGRFLLARGAWLILLELTLVGFGFNFGEPFVFLQVIWAIGFGMMAMSLLSRLRPELVLGVGIALVALGPLAVAATARWQGGAGVLRTLLLSPGALPGVPSLVMYPALPWLGIMAVGFGMGPLFATPEPARARALLRLALALLAGVLLLRWANGYGDPSPWVRDGNPLRTTLSYLNLSKYPPSPDYVMATLGVSLLLFLLLERLRGPLARVLLDFGRTPLFTYIAHIYIAHGAMLLLASSMGVPQAAIDLVARQTSGAQEPIAWGYGLGGVYLAWLIVLLLLVPLSHWFAGVKRTRRERWLSFI